MNGRFLRFSDVCIRDGVFSFFFSFFLYGRVVLENTFGAGLGCIYLY